MCEDGTRIVMHTCKSCDASTWKWTNYGTIKNIHEDRKSANRHKRLHHNATLNPTLGINEIDENTIEECNEENLALTCDFKVNELKRKLNEMTFLSDISL